MLNIVYYQGSGFNGDHLQELLQLQMEQRNLKISVEAFGEKEGCIRRLEEDFADLVFAVMDEGEDSARSIARWMYARGRNRSMVLLAKNQEAVKECLGFYPFQVLLAEEANGVMASVIGEYLKENKKGFMDLEITTKQGNHWLDTREICYLESWGHQITVQCIGGRCCRFRGTLKKYETLLEPYGFVRVHMSFLVNLQHCASMEKEAVMLKDGRKLPLSRDRKELVRQLMEEYHMR